MERFSWGHDEKCLNAARHYTPRAASLSDKTLSRIRSAISRFGAGPMCTGSPDRVTR